MKRNQGNVQHIVDLDRPPMHLLVRDDLVKFVGKENNEETRDRISEVVEKRILGDRGYVLIHDETEIEARTRPELGRYSEES
jgi:hypothetical protein